MPPTLPSAAAVLQRHDALLRLPEDSAPQAAAPDGSLWSWIEANHRHNRRLWAEEDLARRTRASDAEIAANKRAIDRHNQARNDATERIDELLLLALGLVDAASAHGDAPRACLPPGARLHSESAGSMIDRLSILALKIDAMRTQAGRADADEAQRAACRVRLLRLREQRADLAACLDALLADCAAGRAGFKVYRQFKMYNDARFNPALVEEARHAAASTPEAIPPQRRQSRLRSTRATRSA